LSIKTRKDLVVFSYILRGKKMAYEESVSESLIGSAVRVLMRVAFVFEPLAPQQSVL
jgi:hypothetical protein